MADQQPSSTEPQSGDSTAPQAPGSQVPFPNLIPTGVLSPNTEKQVSDLLAEMQQYATTAAPGTTTTMQYSYQKSKHTKESSGQEPKVVESSNVQKSIEQTPPPETQQSEQPTSAQQASILSHLPQLLQGLGGARAGSPSAGQQHIEVNYQHSKSTSTKTTSSGGETRTVTTTESHQYPPPQNETPSTETQNQPTQDQSIFAPLKSAAEKIQEQIGHIPQLLQEKFGVGQTQSTNAPSGQQQIQMTYHHTKSTSTTSTAPGGDTTAPQQAQPTNETTHEQGFAAPLKSQAEKIVSGLEHLLGQGRQQSPAPTPGSVQIEVSKHASRQVTTQSGQQIPQIETTSSGYTQVIQGIFNGVPIVGGIVPVIVPISVSKTDADTESGQTTTQHTGTPQQTSETITVDSSAQLEEQLKKLGILKEGHPVTELLQQTLAKQQRAQTPEANIEIQYTAQRTHSSRTVTYEGAASDPKSAQDNFQQLQNSANSNLTQSQTTPEAPATSQQSEVVQGSHVDDEGNLVISKKTTRVITTRRTVYDEAGQPKTEVSQTVEPIGTPGDQPSTTQGYFNTSEPLIRLKINKNLFKGIFDKDQRIHLYPMTK